MFFSSIKERRHRVAALKRSSTPQSWHCKSATGSPHPRQKAALARAFGCTRMVWNDALALSQDLYKRGERHPGGGELQKGLSYEHLVDRTTFPAGCITMRKSVVERVCTGQQAFSGKGTAIFRDAL